MAIERPSASVDARAWLVFRFAFGVLVAYALIRFSLKGWTATLIADPEFRFPYFGFEWVPRLSRTSADLLCVLGALAALAMALGVWPRRAALLLLLAFGWLKLSDQAFYLNHDFFVIYVALLFSLVPHPAPWRVAAPRMPRYVLTVFRAQVAVIYVFAGIAKIGPDWLIANEPMATWLGAYGDWPVLGWLTSQSWAPAVFSWAGMLFDTTIIAWLAWPKTRRVAFLAVIVFHVMTGLLFPIGMFPIFMVGAASLWLDPAWPARLWPFRREAAPRAVRAGPTPLMKVVLLLYAVMQIGLPLRSHLYPGDVLWTDEGFRFSWRVMLIEKTGHVVYSIVEPSTGRRWEVDPVAELTPIQHREMALRPDMILVYAHHLAERFQSQGKDVEVYADAWASLNGRRMQRLIDPAVDLAREPRTLAHASWILPLNR